MDSREVIRRDFQEKFARAKQEEGVEVFHQKIVTVYKTHREDLRRRRRRFIIGLWLVAIALCALVVNGVLYARHGIRLPIASAIALAGSIVYAGSAWAWMNGLGDVLKIVEELHPWVADEVD